MQDKAPVSATIALRLEKYDEAGHLVEVIERTEEATPELAETFASMLGGGGGEVAHVQLDAAPEKEGADHGTD